MKLSIVTYLDSPYLIEIIYTSGNSRTPKIYFVDLVTLS